MECYYPPMVTNHNNNLEFLPKVRNLTLAGLIALAMLPNKSFGNVQTQTHVNLQTKTADVNLDEVYFQKGMSHYNQAKKPRLSSDEQKELYEQASGDFLKALKQNPKDANVLHMLGDVNVSLRNCTTAIGFLERAVKLERSEETLCSLADAYQCANQYKIAEDVAKEMLLLNEDSVLARKKLGLLSFEQGKLESAVNYWSDALNSAPNDYVLNVNLGGAYFNLGQIKKAKEFARKGVALNPECANGQYVLGLIYEAEGNTKEAITSFEKAIQLNPSADNYKVKLQSLKKR